MKKKIDTKNELKVEQINSKFRTFLFIFCNWLWFPFLWLSIGGFDPYLLKIPVIYDHDYLAWIFLGFFIVSFFYSAWLSNYIGVKYLPRDVTDYYLRKNNNRLKDNNLKVDDVNNLFNVTPICKEVYTKKVKTINKENFTRLSWIEKSKNRLVVNGKINQYDFSWGIISRVKKRNLRFYFFTFLYYGPLFGFFWLFIINPFYLNSTDLSGKTRGTFAKYKRLGCRDLIAKNLGQKNSESYLIFAAKLKNPISAVTLIPKIDVVSHNSKIKNQYDWPASLSNQQKEQLQNLIQTIDFLPSIYVSQDDISIVMKKYHYNQTDDAQFETWELLKQEDSHSDTQFKYLDNALKIYNIFSSKNDVNKKELNNEK